MPWRNLPEWIAHAPHWVQWALGLLTMLFATGMGMMAKIADDVKSGDRDKFWSKKLLLEVPAVGMMSLIAWGVAAHYGLSMGAASALGAYLGWAGPKALEAFWVLRHAGRKK